MCCIGLAILYFFIHYSYFLTMCDSICDQIYKNHSKSDIIAVQKLVPCIYVCMYNYIATIKNQKGLSTLKSYMCIEILK